jgi:hypothetical protein
LELWISDINKILTDEYQKSDGEKHEYLGRGLHHQKQVLEPFLIKGASVVLSLFAL